MKRVVQETKTQDEKKNCFKHQKSSVRGERAERDLEKKRSRERLSRDSLEI